MMEAPTSDGGQRGRPLPLTGKEWLLLLILGAVQITHILDFMIVMPLGPQYMDKQKMGMTPTEFGFMVSAYAFSACITGLLAAFFLDRFDRKNALLVLYFGFAVGTLCCAFAPNYYCLVAARIVTGGFGGIVNATVLTIVGDLYPDSKRGRAMGVLMSTFSIASIFGVPAGLVLADALGWRAPFAVLGIASLMVLAGEFIVLPSIRGHVGQDYRNVFGKFQSVLLDNGHMRAYALMTFLVFGMFTIVPFMPTYLVRNVGCPENYLWMMYFCGGVVTLFTLQGVGWVSDHFSKKWTFRILAVLTMIPILLVTNLSRVPLPTMLVCTTFFMAVTSSRMVPLMALVTACAQPKLRGSFMSVLAAVQQMAMALAAQVAGMIIDKPLRPASEVEALGSVSGMLASAAWSDANPLPLTGFAIVGIIAAITTLLCAFFVSFLRPAVVVAAETDMTGHVLRPVQSNGVHTAAPTEESIPQHSSVDGTHLDRVTRCPEGGQCSSAV